MADHVSLVRAPASAGGALLHGIVVRRVEPLAADEPRLTLDARGRAHVRPVPSVMQDHLVDESEVSEPTEADQHVPIRTAREPLVESTSSLIRASPREQQAGGEEDVAVDENVETRRPIERPYDQPPSFQPEPVPAEVRVRPRRAELSRLVDLLGETVCTYRTTVGAKAGMKVASACGSQMSSLSMNVTNSDSGLVSR